MMRATGENHIKRQTTTDVPMTVDVAINALARPFQTLLGVATLLKYNADHINKIFMVIDADTPEAEIAKFELIPQHCDGDIEFVRSEYSHGYFDNITGPFDDEKYRMGIRYQYAWEHSQADRLFIAHNDCSFTGPVVPKLLEAMGDHLIIGHQGVCWNCAAKWAGKCDRGRFAEYKPTYEELHELYATVQPPASVKFDYGYHLSDFNEKWRAQPWPLPPCRVNEWCCLVDLKRAREVTVPFGPATPFGATTYVGERLVDTSCEWFHDVMNMGFTAGDFPVEQYIEHKWGIHQSFSREKYLLSEKEALDQLYELGVM